MKIQRLRLHISLDERAAEISYRHLVAGLEDACSAAGLDLNRSEGKRAVPQISLGAPLPQGVTSDCELVDLFLSRRIDPAVALPSLRQVMPDGVTIAALDEIGLNARSLSSTLRWADYEVKVESSGLAPGYLQQAIDRLLAADSLPSEYQRENKVRHYDLRPLIYGLRLEENRDSGVLLTMRLCAEQDNTARADQVLLALGIPATHHIHRRRLHLEENNEALLAYRLQGEPGET